MCKKKINFQTKYNQHVLILEYHMHHWIYLKLFFHLVNLLGFIAKSAIFDDFSLNSSIFPKFGEYICLV